MIVPRSCILEIGRFAGKLCGLASMQQSLTATTSTNADIANEDFIVCLTRLIQALLATAASLKLDLVHSIRSKMKINATKYPANLCKGTVQKYTQYSDETGITRLNQHMHNSTVRRSPISRNEMAIALPGLAEELALFVSTRRWEKYDTPRNLALAILSELGELAELVQWLEDDVEWRRYGNTNRLTRSNEPSCELVEKLSQELADVSIYVIRIAKKCDAIEMVSQTLSL